MSRLDTIRALREAAPPTPKPRPAGTRFAAPNTRPEAWQVARHPIHEILGRSRPAVSHTQELSRVLAIPRRPVLDLESPEAKAFALEVTRKFSNGKTTCTCAPLPCFKTLNPVQAWSLHEAGIVRGLLGYVGVGWGKTGLDILTALAIPDVRLAVLLVPPSLVGQLAHEYKRIAQHFHVPSLVLPDGGGTLTSGPRTPWPALHVVPYSRLSRPESTAMLSALKPDLIIADEAHRLKDPKSAGTSRVLRYFVEHPETRLCAWSGTLTAKSIRDYATLSAIALGESSPLPLDPQIVEEWSLAIDPIEWQAPAGALLELCRPGEKLSPAKSDKELDKTYGYQRRLHETFGVVGTKSSAIEASITLHERKPPKMSEHLKELLARMNEGDSESGWTRPDGEELTDILQVEKCKRELVCGFFYKWTFPFGSVDAPVRADGTSTCTCVRGPQRCPACVEVIREWFLRRAAWNKEVRERLKRPMEYLDSPDNCARAAVRYWNDYDSTYEGSESERRPTFAAKSWLPWFEIAKKVRHGSVAQWEDDYLVKDVVEWARHHKGLVWCEHDAFGRKAAALAGMPYYGGRVSDPDVRTYDSSGHVNGISLDGKTSAFVSMPKYHEGVDGFQHVYSNQLIVNTPSLAKMVEQLLGRLHRIGQPADEVFAWVYRHTPELARSIDTALFQAKYIQGTGLGYQKLLAAGRTWEK